MSDLASITSHTHNRVLFLFWLHPFILSPLISGSILGTYRPGNSSFSEHLSEFIFSEQPLRSDRMKSTGEGNGKPLQYSCLENPMNSMKRQKDRTLKDFYPGGLQNHCIWWHSHEIKRRLLLGQKAMTNLESVLRSRDITLPHIVKAMVFPVVLDGCESWTTKKAEHWRIDAFGLWCWRRLLSVPWTARRSNQSILKKISPEYSLEGLMLKLKLQYFGHLMQRTDSLEKTLMLGKIEGGRRRCWQRMRWLDGITDSLDMSLRSSGSWWWTGKPSVLQSMESQRVGHDWATELNWTANVLIKEWINMR